MDIPRLQLDSEIVAIPGKTEEGMETVFAKVTVVGQTLLLTYRAPGIRWNPGQ